MLNANIRISCHATVALSLKLHLRIETIHVKEVNFTMDVLERSVVSALQEQLLSYVQANILELEATATG